MKCYNCDCVKSVLGFSQTRNVCLIQDPEDLWCDECLEENQQQFVNQQDADFDEWCQTI
jgi:hypothetical protein